MPREAPRITQVRLILGSALFLALFHNLTFFRKVVEIYGSGGDAWVILPSLFVVLTCVLTLLLSLAGFNRTLKPVLMLVLVISSVTAYFIDAYRVVIDSDMITNLVQTDAAEAGDLLNIRLAVYLFFLGILPAFLVSRARLAPEPFRRALAKRLALAAGCLLLSGATILASSDFYASFIRTHKVVRYYTNPTTPLYALVKFARSRLKGKASGELQPVAQDAARPKSDPDFELVVLVVGETARADHFSLNGYERQTNPLLGRENLVSFTAVESCATSTAVSVPCMFAFQERRHYDEDESTSTENILDVLKRSGVSILWRDNNSSSKGVADRVEYQSFKDPEVNPLCDPECRDEGMLEGLDAWVERNSGGDVLIVLHQMGSHGPAYYKRYPERFEAFRPVCRSNRLDTCSDEEIVNAYDNTILYTDYFLHRVIGWLKGKSKEFETAMLYFSDHGESLGESGLYLHGMPYAMAPDAQTRVPAILWSPVENHDIDLGAVSKSKDRPLSHDNLFHTLLGIFEIKSGVYRREMDILEYARTYD